MPPGLQYYSPGGMSYVMPNECLGGIFNTSDEACACAGAEGRFYSTGAEVKCEIVDVKEAIFFVLIRRYGAYPIYRTRTAVYVKEQWSVA